MKHLRTSGFILSLFVSFSTWTKADIDLESRSCPAETPIRCISGLCTDSETKCSPIQEVVPEAFHLEAELGFLNWIRSADHFTREKGVGVSKPRPRLGLNLHYNSSPLSGEAFLRIGSIRPRSDVYSLLEFQASLQAMRFFHIPELLIRNHGQGQDFRLLPSLAYPQTYLNGVVHLVPMVGVSFWSKYSPAQREFGNARGMHAGVLLRFSHESLQSRTFVARHWIGPQVDGEKSQGISLRHRTTFQSFRWRQSRFGPVLELEYQDVSDRSQSLWFLGIGMSL